jgi:NAD(P)-dependent dehydrogenase (short-subunit alcohol dehydrogenase family)
VKQAAAQFASEVPLGRRGKPEEVAAAVLFPLALTKTDPLLLLQTDP